VAAVLHKRRASERSSTSARRLIICSLLGSFLFVSQPDHGWDMISHYQVACG
jgi:hypothetical protein